MAQNIRNIAVIAHVDHGKTTLVDALLKQSHLFRDNQEEMFQELIMDSNELERERGITILAKNCAINYGDYKINIIDTPGHADFSGEVERTLGMADGALLIVDAAEGPMPQTRYVLRKALEQNLKIIVVINKIDKPLARVTEVISKIEDLFLELASTDEQLHFPVIYAIARTGQVYLELPSSTDEPGSVEPLLKTIIEHIPAPQVGEGPGQMLVTALDSDNHLGQLVIGKLYQGQLKLGQPVFVSTPTGQVSESITALMLNQGLDRVKASVVEAGDIVTLSLNKPIKIGSTISTDTSLPAIQAPVIGEPTLHLRLSPNSSPLSGLEGKFTTSRQIEERLNKELEVNLSLRVEKTDTGFILSGRGELHLSVLLETLRREGFEFEVGKPEVITKQIDGLTHEPVEEVSILVEEEFVGTISQELGKRQAQLITMHPLSHGQTEFIYHAPTRVLIGLRSLLLTLTKGTVIINSQFETFAPLGKSLPKLRRGVLVAAQAGDTTAYGLEIAQGRGIIFVAPGTKVYQGMIIGQNSKSEDIEINVCKGKKLTNMRSKSSDGIIHLSPPLIFSLEQSLDFLEPDELLEITPQSLRLRKIHLSELDRRRQQR